MLGGGVGGVGESVSVVLVIPLMTGDAGLQPRFHSALRLPGMSAAVAVGRKNTSFHPPPPLTLVIRTVTDLW